MAIGCHAPSLDEDELSDAQIFDLLEFSFEHVAKPVPRDFHSYFSHQHYDYDQPAGRHELALEVNRLFEHNGLAYELRDGQVERLAPTVLQQVLTHQSFATGDATLDQLLSSARDKFLNRDIAVRREALGETEKSSAYCTNRSRFADVVTLPAAMSRSRPDSVVRHPRPFGV
jgi:hypothetical protein